MKNIKSRELFEQESMSMTNEGMMSEIDIIGQEAETRNEFIKELKQFLAKHAADKNMATDNDSLEALANVYFDENGKKREKYAEVGEEEE